MQRLGFCKALVMEGTRFRSRAELVKLLRGLMKSKFWVIPDEPLLEYLRARPGVKEPTIDSRRGIEVSLQDYYISRHPSGSGWLSRLAAEEYVEGLPRHLGLLDDAYRQTDQGQVLGWGLVSEEEMEAFNSVSLETNPLMLTLPQSVFFLYALISSDGDFLIPFAQALSSAFGMATFSFLDAGELVPEVLRRLIERFTGTGYTKEDREQLRRLRSAMASVEEAIASSVEKQGYGSRREQTTIPRMEWLIDLGLAKKAVSEERGRQYSLTPSGQRFASVFSTEYERWLRAKYADEAMASLLDHEFFRLANTVYREEEPDAFRQTDIASYLLPAYETLRGISGYCAVRPLLLLANALRIEEGQGVIEYKDTVEALEKAYRQNPERVYYTTTRRGTDYQLRLDL